MRVWFRIVSWTTVIVGLVLLVLYVGFFDVWTVPSDDPLLTAAIAPTLGPGDVLVVTRRTTIDRGNLLRCADPQAPGRYVIARAMAKWGDQVDLNGEVVSLDGRAVPRPRACDQSQVTVHNPATDEDVVLACSAEEYGEATYSVLAARDHPEPSSKVTIETGKWFLVSDDRHIHLDSRDFGTMTTTACQHVVFRILGGGGFFDSQSRFSIIW
jgi:signal peptidase I